MNPLHAVELGLRYLIAIGFLAVAWLAVDTWRSRPVQAAPTRISKAIEFADSNGFMFIIDHESGRVYRYSRSHDKDGKATSEWWEEMGFKKNYQP